MDTILGTQAFIAPEIRQFQPYTTSVDVWGLGCVLLELLLEKTYDYSYEWAIDSGKCIMASIKKRYQNPEEYQQIIDMLNFVMKTNPTDRPTANQILSYLKEKYDSTTALNLETASPLIDEESIYSKIKDLECEKQQSKYYIPSKYT